MKKIPTLFERSWDNDRKITNVLAVQLPCDAWPTGKWDGTSVLVSGGVLYKRREVKAGKTVPKDFVQVDSDDKTGKIIGWVPVGNGPDERWYHEPAIPTDDGTYELVGPKVQGNPHRLSCHQFKRHGDTVLTEPILHPLVISFDTMYVALKRLQFEGVVWWTQDGPVAKIKRRDFDLEWPLSVGDKPHAI